jgi:hypothetical protein
VRSIRGETQRDSNRSRSWPEQSDRLTSPQSNVKRTRSTRHFANTPNRIRTGDLREGQVSSAIFLCRRCGSQRGTSALAEKQPPAVPTRRRWLYTAFASARVVVTGCRVGRPKGRTVCGEVRRVLHRWPSASARSMGQRTGRQARAPTGRRACRAPGVARPRPPFWSIPVRPRAPVGTCR